jgi:hypothetical protein
MTAASVRAHRKKVAAARRSGDLKPSPECHACFMLQCIRCARLDNGDGSKRYKGKTDCSHCPEHCPNKRARLPIVEGIDKVP